MAISKAEFDALKARVDALQAGHNQQQIYISDLAVKYLDLDRRLKVLEGSAPVPNPTPQPPPTSPTMPHNAWQLAFESVDPNGFKIGSYYDRPTLGQVMKGPNTFDFGLIDSMLSRGLGSFRIMFCRGDGRWSADWMRLAGYPGFTYNVDGNTGWTPDVNDTRVLSVIENLFNRLGEKYDGKLAYIDAPGFGIDGEWMAIPRGKLLFPHPTIQNAKKLIDICHNAFPKTPKIALMHVPSVTPFEGPGEACKYAISKGWGFRVDSWGTTDAWTIDYYNKGVNELGLTEVWKYAPVALEPTGYFSMWNSSNQKNAIDFSALIKASFVQNKGATIPLNMVDWVSKLVESLSKNRSNW